eukprot:g10758.t1
MKRLRMNVFALDYRGFGFSEGGRVFVAPRSIQRGHWVADVAGTPSEEGLIEDALSAWRWLKKEAEGGRIDGDQLFVFGRSLGGAGGLSSLTTNV